MKRRTKFILFAALAATRFFSAPAFGQSFGADLWADNASRAHSPSTPPGPVSHRGPRRITQRGGLNSYAMQPRSQSDFNSNIPAATGGGSVGYNENLYNY